MPEGGWGRIALLAAALIGHGALWVEVVNRTHGLGWPRKLVDAVTFACAAALVGIPLLCAASVASGGTGSSLVDDYASTCVLALVVIAGSRLALRWDPTRDRRTARDRGETLVIPPQNETGVRVAPSISDVPGNQLLRVAVEKLTIQVDRLPASCEGLRVAHLTDLHMSGRLSIEYYKAVVERANAWEPDLAVVTGDIVECTPQLEWIEPTLGQLKAKHGVCCVLGNHDNKIDSEALRGRLGAAGLVDVSRESLRVDDAGGLGITGDERPWFDRVTQAPSDAAWSLRLVHTPDRFAEAVADGVDVVLAGHTHGGQICFPPFGPLLCPSRHGVRYASGTFRRGRTVMHVGRGTGSLFPFRFACPPELALITLTGGVEPLG